MKTPRTVILRKMKGMRSMTPTSENWPSVICGGGVHHADLVQAGVGNEK